MPSLSAADLSVIIPTRRRWDILRATLAALDTQTERGFEIIVVVDGTDEDPPELAGVRVLRQERAGPGVARNLGVRESDRALVMFIGDDMIPTPGLVARHIARHRETPSSEVAVLGRIVWHPDVPRDRVHRWLDWSGALFDYRALEQEAGQDAGWARFYSSNVSLKRDLFLRAGGFDPDFFFDYEDLDLAWRLGQSGMRLVYERCAVTQHLHPYDWAAVQRRYESRAEAEQLMMAKHEWFRPWFRGQVESAAGARPRSHLWTVAAAVCPERPRRLRAAVERRANCHYLQRLAPAFRAAWAAAEPRFRGDAGNRSTAAYDRSR
jgi:GT2 family glycosyltransferase